MAIKGSRVGSIVWACVAFSGLAGFGFGAWHLWATRDPGDLARGRAAYAHGDWADASASATRLLKLDRDDPDAIVLLARSAARRGRDQSALTLYARLAPDSKLIEAEDLYLKGLSLGRLGQTDAATEALDASLVLDPNRPETIEIRCQLYSRQHRPEKAAELAERLSRQSGWESRGQMMLGVIRADMNDPEGAAEALGRGFAAGTKTNEEHPRAFRNLFARTLLQTGRADDARAQLQTVLAQGADPEASWLLSRAYLQAGLSEEARKALTAAASYREENPQAAEPAPYVGEQRCAGCHRDIFKTSLETRHTRTFHRGKELVDLPLPEHPLPDPGDPKILHDIRREQDHLYEETRVGETLYRSIVDYAFGTPERYLTMVGHDTQGVPRAQRLSYHHYGTDIGWDLTSGDTPIPAHPDDSRGRPIDTREGVIRCLACHVTNVRLGKVRVGPETSDRGIGCEHCHGPGGHHLPAVEARLPDLAILNPGAHSSDPGDRACVTCHTLNEDLSEQVFPRDDPTWVRSPGKALTWSRCHTETGRTLSCLTCHDPHRDAETSSRFYTSKCLTCHAPTSSAPVCRVNPREDCVSCHMPPVRNDLLHTSLTDHYIRIHPPKKK